MDNLKELAALTALNNMMAQRYFDICTIDKVARLIELQPSGEAYNVLSTLHCIHYDKMPADLRNALPGLIQEVLGMAPVFQFKTLNPQVIEVAPAKKSGLLRILGK